MIKKHIFSIFEKAKLNKPSFKSMDNVALSSSLETACEKEFNDLLQYWINLGTDEAERCISVLMNAYSSVQNYCDAVYTIKIKTKCYVELNKEPVWWYHADHLGSSSYLTDYTGTPSHYYNYLPFGEEMVAQNTSSYTNVYRFSGKELDEETGLSYFGARYYDPKFSIWLSVDPLAEVTMQPYSAFNNNPIYYTDPTGMIAEPPSTHIDQDGNVIAVFYDGDNGVYQHGKNADGSTVTEYQLSKRAENKGTSSGGTKVGETAY